MLTRLAAIPLLTIMSVAIYTTKIPILAKSGFWKMAHEARTDFAMFLGSFFLLIVGAGLLSLDAKLSQKRSSDSPKEKRTAISPGIVRRDCRKDQRPKSENRPDRSRCLRGET